MRINSENKTMDLEARDINYILPAYLRSYQFHSKNELPTKIIFPMFPSVKAANGVDIPIEYVPPLDAIAVDISKDGSNVAEVTEKQEAVLDEKDAEIARLKEELAQTGRGGEVLGGQENQKQEDELAMKIIDQAREGGKEKSEAEVGGGYKPTKASEETTSEQLEDEAADVRLEEDTEAEAREADTKPEAVTESPAKAAFKVDTDPKHQPPPDRKPKQPPGGDIGTGQPLSDMQPRDRRDQTRTAKDLQVEPEIEGTPEKPFEKEIKRDEKGNPIVEEKPNESAGTK